MVECPSYIFQIIFAFPLECPFVAFHAPRASWAHSNMLVSAHAGPAMISLWMTVKNPYLLA